MYGVGEEVVVGSKSVAVVWCLWMSSGVWCGLYSISPEEDVSVKG